MEKGATTLYESWQTSGSLNHIFFGDISHWFYKYLAGIQIDPENPGYKHFYINPNPVEDLKWVKAEQQSPYGKIISKWEIADRKFVLNVTVPPNTSATILLSKEYFEELIDSGNAEMQDTSDGSIKLAVQSGNYTISAK